jgi:hypothetical protein
VLGGVCWVGMGVWVGMGGASEEESGVREVVGVGVGEEL